MLNRAYLEAKMGSNSVAVALNLLLAAAIYVSAEIGRLMGIEGPGLEISVVWPATGFSLAALLLFGARALPGIFIGNFCYNFIHLFLPAHHFAPSLAIAFLVSAGSLMQALAGGFVLRRFSSESYLNSVKDVFYFLFFGGILTCVVASTVGVSTLYLFGAIPWQSISKFWMTFWLGDLFGIYIFTPVIVVWTLHAPIFKTLDHLLELFCQILSYIVLSILVMKNYPVAHIYIPLTIWSAYRFHMHGATLAIFAVSLYSVWLTSLGMGSFVNLLEGDALPILVSFLAVIVATSLILAAFVYEREIAMRLLKNQNIGLQENIDKRLEKIEEMHREMIIKEKLASLGMMILSIAEKMKDPLNAIGAKREEAAGSLNFSKNLLSQFPGESERARVEMLLEQNEKIRKSMQSISDNEQRMLKILDHVRELSLHSESEKMSVKLINLQTLINQCLDNSSSKAQKNYPEMKIEVRKRFTRTIPMIPALPEELSSVCCQILELAIEFMQLKRKRFGEFYKPQLLVQLIDEGEMIELKIEIANDELSSDGPLSQEELELEKKLQYKAPIAKDMISFLQRGELDLQFKLMDSFKAKVMLPRTL